MNKRQAFSLLFILSLTLAGVTIVSLHETKEARGLGASEIQEITENIADNAYNAFTDPFISSDGEVDREDVNIWEVGPHGLAIDLWGGSYDWIQNYLRASSQGAPDKATIVNNSATQNSAMIYEHAQYLGKDSENILKVQNNHIRDARNLVWSKIEHQTAKAIEAGETNISTEILVKEEVRDYYSSVEKNLVLQLSQQVRTLKHLVELDNNRTTEFNETKPFVVKGRQEYSAFEAMNVAYYSLNLSSGNFYQRNFTLINGSKVTVWDIDDLTIPSYPNSHDSGGFDAAPFPDEQGHWGGVGDTGGPGAVNTWLYHKSFGNFSEFEVWDSCSDETNPQTNLTWADTFDLLYSEKDKMINEVEAYVPAIYQNYTAGDINLSEIMSPETFVQEMQQKWNDSKYFGYSTAKLSLLGINTSLNKRVTIHVYDSETVPQFIGENITGMFYSDVVPRQTNGNWITGHRYNTSNMSVNNPLIYFVNNDGIFKLHTTFEIINITTWQGEQVDNMTTEEVVRYEYNNTNFTQQLGQLEDLYQNYSTLDSIIGIGSNTNDSTKGTSWFSSTVNNIITWFKQPYLLIPRYIWVLGFLALVALGEVYVKTKAKQ